MLGIAARRADIVGIIPPSLRDGGIDQTAFTVSAMDAKIGALETAVAASGRTDGGPERSLLAFGIYPSLDRVPDDDWVPPDLVEASPWALLGETSAMADALVERRERWGLSYVVCFGTDLEAFAPVVRRLAG
jgi:hypothetical protein